jgi:hypothetical protein
MKARVRQLCKTEAEWNSFSEFVPMSGELIIFSPDEKHAYARLKIGDGIVQSDGTTVGTKLKELPFVIDATINNFLSEQNNNDIIDSGRITVYKN